MKLPRRQFMQSALALSMLTICGCSPKDKTSGPVTSKPQAVVQLPPLVDVHSQIVALWQSQQVQMSHAIEAANALAASVQSLMANPDDTTLAHSQQQWHLLMVQIEPLSLANQLSKRLRPPASSPLLEHFDHLLTWPIHVSYLDEDLNHGKTGLIFDLDTPITPVSLRFQHRLTSANDAALGLYAIGALLAGTAQPRQPADFLERTELNENELTMGYTFAAELPTNRRRELLKVQVQLLLSDLESLLALWGKRDRSSALNALSQASYDNQRQQCLRAAMNLATQQLLDLKSSDNLPITKTAAWYTVRDQRWLAQLNGLEQWLSFMDEAAASEQIASLMHILAGEAATTATPTQPTETANLASSTSAAAEPQASPEDSTGSQLMEGKLAEISLILKRAMATTAQ